MTLYVSLQKAIDLCSKIENKEIEIIISPFIDKNDTCYIVSIIPNVDAEFIKFTDCTDNSQPNWEVCRFRLNSLYLKNKISKNIYFITD